MLALAACAEPVREASDTAPPRAGRFGSLRDLVLFERAEAGPEAALFVDRFEVTRGDWAAFARTPAGRAVDAALVPSEGDATLPVASVSLRQARAFAHWRFLRLPRTDEWMFVAVGDRRNAFPWGNRVDPMRANTADLGLGQPTPVGTFESGRRAGGDQPYDLIGNVSEWTETVPGRWWDERSSSPGQPAVLDPISGVRACRRAVLRTPALAVWQGPAGLVPAAWLVAAGGEAVPREVVGSDFLAPMEEMVESLPAGDRRARTGIRLLATAGELLVALCADTVAPAPQDLVQLRRFVRRGRHRELLVETWRTLVLADAQQFGDGPVARVLRQELGFDASSGR